MDDREGHSVPLPVVAASRFLIRSNDPCAVVPVVLESQCVVASPPHIPLQLRDAELRNRAGRGRREAEAACGGGERFAMDAPRDGVPVQP
jgi:hypothetical protein